MEVILYIALWLLSGFLAAWIAWAVIDKREVEAPNSAVAILTLGGPVSLFFVLLVALQCTPPLFKAKGPK